MGRTQPVVGLCLSLMLIAVPAAADKERKPLEERAVYRFEFDNDTFVDSDDAFTAGWSVQRHSRPWDTWDETRRNPISRWIAHGRDCANFSGFHTICSQPPSSPSRTHLWHHLPPCDSPGLLYWP